MMMGFMGYSLDAMGDDGHGAAIAYAFPICVEHDVFDVANE